MMTKVRGGTFSQTKKEIQTNMKNAGMQWPSQLPDLNSIGNWWPELKIAVHK